MGLFNNDKDLQNKQTVNLVNAKKEIEKFHRLVSMDGSWNASDYMLGQYNALEYVVSILNDKEPEFRSLPKKGEENDSNGK